jgi:hypothetical protein
MKRVPGSQDVSRALVTLMRSLDRAVSQMNERAAAYLSKGDYSSVETMMQSAKAIQAYRERVEEFRREWAELLPTGSDAANSGEATKLWEYYRPILRTLADMGGSARRADIEDHLGKTLAKTLQPGDFVLMARGVPRWKVMVRRARKPMIREGFIEDGNGRWHLTPTGRKAANLETVAAD